MLRCSVERRAATAAEVDAALASLDGAAGVYFGCDAGVAGLHPLQATLVSAPALALHVFDDGVEVTALQPIGAALLAHPALSAFSMRCGRAAGRSSLACLRAFLAAFSASSAGAKKHVAGEAAANGNVDAVGADVLLVGAFRFEAHTLSVRANAASKDEPAHTRSLPASAASNDEPLGVLFFAPTLLRRDGANAWWHVAVRFDDIGLAALQVSGHPEARAGAIGAIEPSADRREPASAGAAAADPCDDFAPGAYAAVVARAVERLTAQPLVSLTLSQSFRRRLATASPVTSFAALRRANPAPATFFVGTGNGDCVFGASPDLQLQVKGRAIESFPVCGTVARGHGPVGEAESFRQLINEEVDAASLAVCTDALRNDLAPLCEPGSLRLTDRRRPMALATVVHTVDRFGGRLRTGVDAWDAIVATAAPVMVTGTPRRLALAAIADLEAGPRGWYGGLVVQVAANGDALVGTILRAAAIRAGVAEVRTGGDLLADSDPVREEHESRIKAVSLWRALGLAVADDLQASIAGGERAQIAGGVTSARRLAATDARGARAPPAAVALRDANDPFGAAVTDALRALGIAIDAAATPVVLIGSEPSICRAEFDRRVGLVALGDAAARVLELAGFSVSAIRPEHGRLVRCLPGDPIPGLPALPPFLAMRYATLDVGAHRGGIDSADAWQAWLRDPDGRPLAAVNAARRSVCLLFRPESLLADPEALEALRAALAFASAPGR